MYNRSESCIIILFITGFVILLVFLIVAGLCTIRDSGLYEYTDLDNNIGIAIECSNYRTSLMCALKDGTIIQVKKYKRIERE